MVLIGAALVFSSCQQDETLENVEQLQKVQDEVIVVPVNPLTGEPEVQNYVPMDTDEIGAETISKAVGGQIIDDQEVRVGIEPNHSLEVDGRLPAGYVLTGIGARARDGKITTLVLEGRYVNSNGTMGTRKRFKFGSEPNHGLEVWYAAPNQHTITGLGARITNGNITTLKLRHRRLGSNRRLSTNYYTARTGTEPNNSLEAEFLPAAHGLNVTRVTLTRVGMREKSNNLTTLQVWASTLR